MPFQACMHKSGEKTIMSRTNIFLVLLLSVFSVIIPLAIAESSDAGRGEFDPAELPAEEFLRYARRPFIRDAWGYFAGTVQHRGSSGVERIPVQLSILFKKDLLKAQLLLDKTQEYNITQIYMGDTPPEVTVTEPERSEGKVKLSDFGLYPRDITFAFLYWDFIRESSRTEKVRGQQCRVMLLDDPRSARRARVWFSAKYLFPLRVHTLGGEDDRVVRELEFTDFKRHDKIWYIKALRLEGTDWKTRVNFREAELAYTSEEEPPPNLFAPDVTANALN